MELGTALNIYSADDALPECSHMTLEELIAEANQYGTVRISQMDDGKWHSRITYHSVSPGVLAEALSDYKHITAQGALAQAINIVRVAWRNSKTGE